MARLGVELLLVAFAVFTCLGFIVTYLVAVYENHVTPDLPYISDTGGKAPESCIFSFICGVAAVLVLLIVYVRFKHVRGHHARAVRLMWCLNPLALAFGVVSAVGMIAVGSFQDDVVPSVHFLGALMVFGGGCIYQWLQTAIGHYCHRGSHSPGPHTIVTCVRLFLCVAATGLFILAVVAGLLAGKYHMTNENISGGGTFYWQPVDGGFGLHVASTVAEWAASTCFLLFFLTLHGDFVRIRLDVSVVLRRHHMASPSITDSTPLSI